MARTNEVRLDDTVLHVVEHGEGPPLMFFHGGLGDHRAALLSCGSLADRARVITPDLRGSGRSHWHGALSWDLLADDAAAVLDALELPSAVVGGTSFGCGVALATALRHPERVHALALFQPVHAGEEHGLDPASRQALQAMDALGQRCPDEGTDVLLSLFASLPPSIGTRAEAMVRSFDPKSVAATTAFLASGVQPFATRSDLAAIRCRTMVVPGDDPQHPAQVAEWMAQAIPHATMEDPADALDALADLVEGPS